MDNVVSLISKIRSKSNKLIMREMARRNINGLVTSHGDILVALFQQRTLTMKEIADKIEKDKSTVTVLISKLIAQGYIKKERDAFDSRIVLVSLSDKGKKLKSDFEDISKKLLSAVYQGVSEEEKRMLAVILQKINHNL
jgi:MarR family transcriptional regulator, organic hydroperoxide resistance regulator